MMTKIVLSSLHLSPIKTFMYDLTTGEVDTITGGGYPSRFYINNVTDEVSIKNLGGDNTIEAGGIYSVSNHDNKINTIDYSRSIHNRFI
ncbi:hypothetical protein Nos7524_0527 [Nostoc sp. PCC 7524]|uniref:hypothetical protein n=1 Tax=Nostoc sp. (strain ATCC 29411 / PCC 7524) TaxID=28072 RepID=UPI00029ED217|nr:hypothetical protein [Nostoc sp. PCC 7524]AFY46438.1 hypothetical protein Nos7524_0527 [Nostoc sp. PCC 7524]